jgi:hypothetical protein
MKPHYWIVGGLCAASIVFFAIRVNSQTPPNALVVERTVRTFTPSGDLTLSETSREIIQQDGSKSLSRIRTYREKSSATGWETVESKMLYSAPTNVTTDIFPALKMYGQLPVGKTQHLPLDAKKTCATPPDRTRTVKLTGSVNKFGRDVEMYHVEVTGSDESPYYRVSDEEYYPGLGCLIGDQSTEMKEKTTNKLLSRQVETLLSLSYVPLNASDFASPPSDYTQAKPSEILIRNAEMQHKPCPQCTLDSGAKLDEKHDRLWNERKAGK